ncbi:sigma 54-interacting transcriptional regulator [Clostridium estertheticum]|uniref:sigma 54-interacting transcriptional regulator n=1 Tax=Clostridium estertheticum TaxID=238834 RepID=UPI00217ECB6D|nr:sigma 54-interacting transcriptional regulator [Clostridium estertheticum]
MINMELKIMDIINSEDKKNPFTDESIASQLKILREAVTEYRKEYGISDSRERRKKIISEDALEILKNDEKISDRNFTKELNLKGYKIERFAASNIRKEASKFSNNIIDKLTVEKINYSENEINYSEKEMKEKGFDPFELLIGYEGSLKILVNQAKAAILYPPKGLHTLLLGPSGVGKSYIAEIMYSFAKTTNNFSAQSPFMIFNCADYADNPQLLLSQLFGHAKGAFTGASEMKKGVVEICKDGILFLDEIHRLPKEGQEILFYLLDKGKFRRLGETEVTRESNLMIIAATTESPENSLLLTFRRRIPMIIEIPSIAGRAYDERFQMIKSFFKNESIRIGKDIFIGRGVIKSFMTYDCPGNIGQLKSDIQVCCAKGFLFSTLNNKDDVKVTFQHVPDYIKEQVINSNVVDEKLEKYTSEDIIASPTGVEILYKDQYNPIGKDNIYQFIEDRFKELKIEGYSVSEINKLIGKQVEGELTRFASIINSPSANPQELVNIIGENILKITEDIFKLAKEHINGLQIKIVYPLAIHLSSTYDRMLNLRTIVNPNLQMVKEKHKKEYNVAIMMAELINNRLKINLPEDEIGFIALYLKHFQQKNNINEGRVGVIVLSHGRVASGMAEVVNKLLGVNQAVGLEMDLSDSPDIMLEKTIKLVRKVDQGKGCLLLVDMGSLTTFGDIITAKTGILTRVIVRVDTVMVLECVRRALLPEYTLDNVADGIDKKDNFSRGSNKEIQNMSKVIITICITGEGSAIKVKEYIENSLGEQMKDIDIIPLGYMNNEDITATINKISKYKQILAIVGTINPEFEEVPFISVEQLVTGKALGSLKKLIGNEIILKNRLSEVIPTELISIDKHHKYKDEIIDEMNQLLVDGGYVEEGFLLSVYKRESLGNTYLKGAIAIPHGDSKFVTKPTIAITRLAKPVSWDGVNNVDIIFLIALDENSKEYFEQLYKVISSGEALLKIRESKDKNEIIEILFENTVPSK